MEKKPQKIYYIYISTHTHAYMYIHMHGIYDIYHLLNEYSFITYHMPVAAHIYMEDDLFKEQDSFPNKFDINSNVSITLSEESHCNPPTDNNLSLTRSLFYLR